MGTVQEVNAGDNVLISRNSEIRKSVIHFYEDWSEECLQIKAVLSELATKDEYQDIAFRQVKAESLPGISKRYDITAVPTLIFSADGEIVDRLEGANVASLQEKVKSLSNRQAQTGQETQEPEGEALKRRIKTLVSSSKVMLFMKGDKSTPRCGFSKQIIEIMNETGLPYETFDILQDEEIRQGLKVYSNWPTFPQLYVNGILIGGLDIIKDLKEGDELIDTLTSDD